MSLPPGPAFLIHHLPLLVAPPACVYALFLVCREWLGVNVPGYCWYLACVLSLPSVVFVKVQRKRTAMVEEAKKLGAVLPPQVEHKWPAGIDLLVTMSQSMAKAYPADWLINWANTYGYTFSRDVFYEKRIATSEPEHIKKILVTDFEGFEKGPKFRDQMASLLGTGVLNSDGEMWKFHRTMTRPFFTKDRISHFEIFDKHASSAFEQMKARFVEGHSVDWQDLVSRFTLDSAAEFLFGQDVKSLTAGLPYPPSVFPLKERDSTSEIDRFSQAFTKAQYVSMMRARFISAWPLFEFWRDEVKEQMKPIDQIIDQIIANAIRQKGSADGIEDETLLRHMVKATEDPQILKDEILNILLAGRDTTAATLTFAVYKLAQNPDILKRLRQEILTKVGKTRRPDYEDIREMKYLRAVVNETLRLYPPLPFNLRFTNRATVWPSKLPGAKPFYIPAKTRIQYSLFVMHRRKDLWGPDALVFDPDRFLDERLQKYLTPNPFIFLPFNAGPRVCLGQEFAYNEVSFMLVRLLQQFSAFELTPWVDPASNPPPGFNDSVLSDGKETVWISANITLYVKNGLWLKMKEADPEEEGLP